MKVVHGYERLLDVDREICDFARRFGCGVGPGVGGLLCDEELEMWFGRDLNPSPSQVSGQVFDSLPCIGERQVMEEATKPEEREWFSVFRFDGVFPLFYGGGGAYYVVATDGELSASIWSVNLEFGSAVPLGLGNQEIGLPDVPSAFRLWRFRDFVENWPDLTTG